MKQIYIALACGLAFLWGNIANAAFTPCGAFWPQDADGGRVIPVCYTAAARARPGFSSWLPVARQAVESTWGRATNISFSSWRQCPANVSGEILVMDYQPGASPGTVTCHTPGQIQTTFQDPASISSTNWAHTAVHEFGHALGLKHEQDRSDNPYWTDKLPSTGNPSLGCSSVTASSPWTSNVALFLTSYDYYSIMNYCGEGYDLGVITDPFQYWLYANADRSTLSPLDVVGVQYLYGIKPAQSIIAGNGLALTLSSPTGVYKGRLTLSAPRGGINQQFNSSQNRIASDYFWFGGSALTTPGNNSLRWTFAGNGAATLIKQKMLWMTNGANCIVPESAAVGSRLLSDYTCDTKPNEYWDLDLPFNGAIRLNGTNLCVANGIALGDQLQLADCPAQPTNGYTFVEGHSMLMSTSGYCIEPIHNSNSFGIGLVQCANVTPAWLTMHFRGPITVSDMGNYCLSSTPGSDGMTLGGPVVCDGSLAQTWDFWLRSDYNLALGQFAYQSSINVGGDASRAVDGNTDGNFWDGSVSLTNFDPNAWWTVNLGGPHVVHSVDIYNRTDYGSQFLSHFIVYAWDDVAYSWYPIADYSTFDTTNVAMVHVVVPATTTQHILIQKTDTNYLQMAEVQVIGR